MRNLTRALGLAVALTIASACAGAVPIIATITSIAAEAVEWVNVIADFVARAPVDDATHAQIAKAVQTARLAAITLQRAGRGADHLSREQLDQAFAEFRQAYEALLQLVEPLGVRKVLPDGARLLGAGPDGLGVPPASDFSLTPRPRDDQAAEPAPTSWFYLRTAPQTPAPGFVPLPRELGDHRPWHAALAQARGQRS